MLECRLYAKNILKEKFIGGTKDAIELLLAEGTAGGLYDSMVSLTFFTLSYHSGAMQI